VTLGALLAAVRTQGNDAKLGDQRIVIMGAGSAGMGVAASLAQAMMTREGLSAEAAAARFWVLDKDGLMTSARPEASFSAVQKTFARPIAKAGGRAGALCDGAGLTDVVRAVQPTILLGFTGVGGAFPEAAVRAMAAHCARPIIFPLSNPTANAECTAQQAYEWTDGKAVFGGGSPFDAVTIKGVTIEPSQINNMFMFPGMGLCSVAVRPRRITDSMFQAAAVAMASMVTPADLALGRVVPRVRDIRAVSAKVAAAAAQQAMHEGIVNKMPPAGDLTKFMEKIMYDPIYRPLVCNPRG
jgi:malic enzyme